MGRETKTPMMSQPSRTHKERGKQARDVPRRSITESVMYNHRAYNAQYRWCQTFADHGAPTTLVQVTTLE